MFVEEHGLWSDEQRAQAQALRERLQREPVELIRLASADPHGASRAKAVSPAVFFDALERGYNINVATTTLDSAGARVFSSFTRGGGMGLAEMTGSPNLVIVPDPGTFRLLPWASGVARVLCDEYFRDGRHGHPAGLPPARLLRHVHGAPRPQGLLRERLAPAPVARRQRGSQPLRRQGPALAAGRVLPRRRARARGRSDRIRHTQCEWLSTLPAELARSRPRRLGI